MPPDKTTDNGPLTADNDRDSDLARDLLRARMLATWMDARFSLLGIRVGMDSIIGLVPGVGDALSAAISCYPLHIAMKHQLGRGLMVRMGVNIAIDFVVGLIPVAGDAVAVG
jgi:hypothetical protein